MQRERRCQYHVQQGTSDIWLLNLQNHLHIDQLQAGRLYYPDIHALCHQRIQKSFGPSYGWRSGSCIVCLHQCHREKTLYIFHGIDGPSESANVRNLRLSGTEDCR